MSAAKRAAIVTGAGSGLGSAFAACGAGQQFASARDCHIQLMRDKAGTENFDAFKQSGDFCCSPLPWISFNDFQCST